MGIGKKRRELDRSQSTAPASMMLAIDDERVGQACARVVRGWRGETRESSAAKLRRTGRDAEAATAEPR